MHFSRLREGWEPDLRIFLTPITLLGSVWMSEAFLILSRNS
jgi:hypothetical protein